MSNLLETKNLFFSYPDGTPALEDITMEVKPGEFIGILGANGSGKTTLLKLLNGLLKPTRGEAHLEQKDIRSINRDALFTKICTCFQNPDHQLFSATVAQDIAFGPLNMGLKQAEVQRRVGDALSAVRMSEFANMTINSLSFGQKKRICLAGVLAMSPEVILLDEPTASLDPGGVGDIMHLLKELNRKKGVTMLMATHSVDLVPLFIDRVFVLNRGKMILEGIPQKVFSDSDTMHPANLRLPRIGQLFEALKKEDGFSMERLPLTVGEARMELKNLLANTKTSEMS